MATRWTTLHEEDTLQFASAAPQTGNIANQAPLMSRLASTSAYLLGANVPRLNIFKASQTPSGVCSACAKPRS